MIILSFINGKVVKNSPLCKSCTDPVTYLNFPFQSNSVCQCPFFKKIFSHTHSSNYSRPLEFPSELRAWGSPTPSISIPKFSLTSPLTLSPSQKTQSHGSKIEGQAGKSHLGELIPFSTPSVSFGYKQIPFFSLCNVHVPKSILHRSQIWIGFIDLQLQL